MDQIGLGAFKEICFYSKNWPGSVMGTGLIVLEKWELKCRTRNFQWKQVLLPDDARGGQI